MAKRGFDSSLSDLILCTWLSCNHCIAIYTIQGWFSSVSILSAKTRLDDFSHSSIFPCLQIKEINFSSVYITQMFLNVVNYHTKRWLQSEKSEVLRFVYCADLDEADFH